MKLNIERSVLKGVFGTVLRFGSYGTTLLTPVEEKEIIEDFGVTLAYKDITFEGNYEVVEGEVVAGGDDTVTISLNNLEFAIDENFEVTYNIATANILPTEIGDSLNTPELVAQAKCILFEDKIQEKLSELLTDARAKKNAFERALEVTI